MKKAFLLVLAVTMLLTAPCGAALAADEADQGLIDIAEERAALLAEMFSDRTLASIYVNNEAITDICAGIASDWAQSEDLCRAAVLIVPQAFLKTQVVPLLDVFGAP